MPISKPTFFLYRNPDVEVCIKSPSGEIFIDAGEDTTGGVLEPDDSEYISGKKII
ncbi:DUF6386 family protein [Xenorhabdus bovienii]|uniref:DUF6386 family protein n=1 Tax=Xenorhabdus bovienii TaxID=40576 RepID=UPI0030572D09|nr:DUF6386 family protein [Xenorhabdus bovienii]MDE9586165.1 DUF6386 family protein [Xenorhabdus bovienii]